MEIIVGLGIVSIMVGASTYALVAVLRSSTVAEQNQSAGIIGNSLLESAFTLAEANWNSIYGLDKTLSNHYFLAKSPTTTPTPVPGDESVLEQDISNGLVGYWKFDEAKGTASYDSSGNGNTGTLTNIVDINSGLVGYWKFDEGSGSTVTDFSGYNNTGTLYNSPIRNTAKDCKFSGCLTFNGTSTYADVGAGVSDSLESSGSISMWIKPTALGGLFSRSTGTSWTSERLVLNFYSTSGRLDLTLSNGTSYWRHLSNSIIPLGVWTHVVVNWNGTTVNHYINGVLDRSQTQGGVPEMSGVKTWLGRVEGLTPNYFSGAMDDVRIYNRVLSATEVSRLYNMNNCKAGNCLAFDGVNNYVTIPHNAVLNPVGSTTISVWVNPTSVSSASDILNKTWPYSGDLYWLRINAGGTIYWHIGTVDTITKTMSTVTAIQANRWTHIVATYNGSKGYIFINGVRDANSITVSPPQNFGGSTYALYIGRRSVYFPGLIDEVRIYNRVLSDTEILQLYNSPVFSRYFYVDNVNRTQCGAGGITSDPPGACLGTTGIVEDPSTQKITVGTMWSSKGVFENPENSIFATRWVNNIVSQGNWSGTSGVTTPVTDFSSDYYSASNLSVTASGTIKISGF